MGGALATENLRRHIPEELVEEILMKLPHKSVLRFSSVSKSWNTMIHGSRFVRRYRGRDHMIVFTSEQVITIPRDYYLLGDATPLFCPFESRPYLVASCDELWCVDVGGCLFLWNPSMRTYRKLPTSSLLPDGRRHRRYDHLSFGLGYDSVNDDYKILIISQGCETAEVFSLKSNSWRSIHTPPNWIFPRSLASVLYRVFPVQIESLNHRFHKKRGVFVAGALHWMAVPYTGAPLGECMVISFDLSTEKYRELGLPKSAKQTSCVVETTALKGMLCLGMSYWWMARFVLWTMEDYGVVDSWTKKLQIDYESRRRPWFFPRLVYFRDDGECAYYKIPLLSYVCGTPEKAEENSEIFVYKDKQTRVEKNFHGPSISDSTLVYVESLVLANN